MRKDRDQISEAEFLLTGYVTGSETLYPDIKQLQAGELIEIDFAEEKPQLSAKRYYRYKYTHRMEEDKKTLLHRLDETLQSTFKRLIKYADERPIVIPLSGGYDSRLAVLMLKRLGYENILTFSFGRAGNAESTVSKEIAENLNVPWRFVEFTNEKWHDWYHSEERKSFYTMAYDYSALPGLVHMVWPAVWELKQRGELPENALFVPGHSADFVAGSHLPEELLGQINVGENDLVDCVWRHHYNLWQCGDNKLKRRLQSRIRDRLRENEEPVDAFEEFDWQERQSKFILADLRSYEFWGYNWWIPFWDREFMDFWRSVPNKFRHKKELYDTYVQKLYAEMTDVEQNQAKKTQDSNLLRRIHSQFKSSPLFKMTKPIYKRVRYSKAVTAWPGIMPKQQFLELYTGREGRHAFFVLDLLGKVSFKPSENYAPPVNGEVTWDMLEGTEN